MTKRIFRSICAVAVTVFLASVIIFSGVLFDYFSELRQKQLKNQTLLVVQGVRLNGEEYFTGLDLEEYRVTWVSPDGGVQYDSAFSAAQLENHLDREEIKEAVNNGYGEAVRRSQSGGRQTLYSAMKLPDGSVLRLSVAKNSVFLLFLGAAQPFCLVLLLILLLSFFLANRLAKKVVEPLNSLNLDNPLSGVEYDEIMPLLHRISTQQQKLKRRSAQLQKKRDELLTVTDSMAEGFLLLSPEGIVRGANRTARQVLFDGREADTVYEQTAFSGLLALLGRATTERCEEIFVHDGRSFLFAAGPVISDEKLTGITVFITDVTEKEGAEQLRREFSANVSHELKTPLHSISGYAELLKNGMVKSKDVASFSDKIYTEAQRLVRLVEDIIHLSHLDEGADDLERTECDLLKIANDTIEQLCPVAKAANVSISVSGESTAVFGISGLFSGIVYNLCDNAIKYNKKGGSVSVSVGRDKNGAFLSVADTGIGIAAEHRARVFERFYRVDKSHSKEVGGTGLGLSIVKHAVMVLGGQIFLQSEDGVGTTVTVRFK